MTSGYDLVRVTLHGITHAARMFVHWGIWEAVGTACGTRAGTGVTHKLGEQATVAPNVDCMSCLVAEDWPRAR